MSKGITYHIITIVAIFSALGLGIFIGSMLNGEQLMVSHQS
ncbi:MAG: Copper transport outer membrane protein MctB, partial [Petroclostridium sp.]|nr:Copper transport outer membrane protein MctB [Petroclostridium sp.]